MATSLSAYSSLQATNHWSTGKVNDLDQLSRDEPSTLDPTTIKVLRAWRDWQQAEQEAAGVESDGWVFTGTDGKPVHPYSISQTFERISARARVPRIRLHDLRHTHGTLLIKAGVPVKVVSERLGHANPAFTIDTYQHVLPGMQADAARIFEQLINEQPPGTAGRRNGRRIA